AHEGAADRRVGAARHVQHEAVEDVEGAGVGEAHEVTGDVEHAAAGHADEVAPGDVQQAGLERHHGDGVVRGRDLGAVDEADGVVAGGEGGPALQIEERRRCLQQGHVDLVRAAAHGDQGAVVRLEHGRFTT